MSADENGSDRIETIQTETKRNRSRVCVCACVCVCVCVRACALADRIELNQNGSSWIELDWNNYQRRIGTVCVRACVCVDGWDRNGSKQNKTKPITCLCALADQIGLNRNELNWIKLDWNKSTSDRNGMCK